MDINIIDENLLEIVPQEGEVDLIALDTVEIVKVSILKTVPEIIISTKNNKFFYLFDYEHPEGINPARIAAVKNYEIIRGALRENRFKNNEGLE